ncbi:MAG: efflux RND transporter permease subunit, partial [Desulfococcus multivorans]|nr:efflux RND transporter permease subunit [Desulfococcus multivorans]
IANVAQSVLYGGGLAVAVLLFFLRNIRSTIVISVAIPISVVATFALIYFGGFTLNLMTLGGLALGVGMMVDSSVVVLENIVRRAAENGETPTDAAVNGAQEVGPAIVASTITTLVVFLPMAFVRGVSGILFQELAYVIIFSLVCSLLVSLSLAPMLASRLLRPAGTRLRPLPARIARWGAALDRLFEGLNSGYRDVIGWVLDHRGLIVAGSVAALGGSLLLLPMIGSEFLPPSDEGEVRVTGEMEIGIRLDLLDRQVRRMEDIITAAVPEAVSWVASLGATGWRPGQSSEGEIRISLQPAGQRTRTNVEIATELRRRHTGRIPGMAIRTQAPQGQLLLERILGGEEGLTIEIRGFELETLNLLSQRVAAAVAGIPGLTDIDVENEGGMPQQEIYVDRAKAADLGLSVRDVTEVLETAVAGSRAGEYRTGGNAYRIFVQLEDVEKRSLDEILDLTLTAAAGESVALRNLVATRAGEGPIYIDRKDQQRIVTVRANVTDGDLGTAAKAVQARLEGIPRPVEYDLQVAGTFEEQQKAFRELVLSLVLALVFVYMVLACQYESLRDPVIVMVSVPLAAVGVLVTLFLTDTTLNLQSYIGCIMLGGIVVNNAILLVDQAGRLQGEGMSPRKAVTEAGRRRLRPILMTTLTTILALLPLAFGIGEGADAQAPLARAVVGGLTGSTLITLMLIPAVYLIFHPEPKGRDH